MAKLPLNQRFPARISRRTYALVTVVDPEGRPKILTVKPGNEKNNWLHSEWGHDKGGRKVLLRSVDLTSEREAAGALFLKQAYDDEGFAEGWAQWESYVDSQYRFDVVLDDGKTVKVNRDRAVFKGHFPSTLLPKRVQQMQENAKVTRKGPMWEPDESIVHPADVKPKSRTGKTSATAA